MIPRARKCRKTLVAVLVPLIFILVAGDTVANTANRYYEDAARRYQAGDFDSALIQLRNALRQDPSQLPARLLKSRIFLDAGNAALAEEELLDIAKLGVDPALIALPLASARNLLGKHELNLEELRPSDYPSDIQADLWAELGKARSAVKDRAGAEIAFAEALQLVPFHEQTMLSQARDLLNSGQLRRAEPLIVDALGRYPESAGAWFLMGSVYHARGEIESALGHYRRAAELDPNHRRAALGVAVALLDRGDPAGAANHLRALVEALPHSLEARFFLARALKQAGEEREAESVLKQAADLVNRVTPNELAAFTGHLLLAATFAEENGQHEAAFRFLTKHLEQSPDDLMANKQLAALLIRMEKPERALNLLKRMNRKAPDDLWVLVMLGDVSSQLKDYVAAEAHYRKALVHRRSDAALVRRIGASQVRQGAADSAIRMLQTETERSSAGDTANSVFAGILHLSQGNTAEARKVADRIIEDHPDNPIAQNLLAASEIADGRHDQGRERLNSLLSDHPEYLAARINLIKLDVLEERFTDAEEALDDWLAIDPENVRVMHEAANLAMAKGDRASALAWLKRIRQSDAAALRPSLDLAGLYLSMSEPGMALAVLRELDRAVPDNLFVKKALARVHLTAGEVSLARSRLNEAGRLAGDDASQLLGIARMQVSAGALEPAEKNLRRGIERQPLLVALRLELAGLMLRQTRFPESIAMITGVLEQEPDSLAGISLLGDSHLAMGQLEQAEALYRRALSLADSPELMISLHRTLVRMGKSDQAFQELQDWHRARPDNPLVMRLLAHQLLQMGAPENALDLYLRLAELEPDDAGVQNNLANLLLPVDSERALKAAFRAYELARDNPAVLDTLGWTLVQLGELERGLAHLREATIRASRAPTIRYHLGVTLEESGRTAEARAELRRALRSRLPFAERQLAEQRLHRLEAR